MLATTVQTRTSAARLTSCCSSFVTSSRRVWTIETNDAPSFASERSRPAISRKSEDLPTPFGPVIAKAWPDTLENARFSNKTRPDRAPVRASASSRVTRSGLGFLLCPRRKGWRATKFPQGILLSL